MTVEGLKVIFDWFAVILLFLTFAAGVGVLITGNIINERQGEQLRQFDQQLTDARGHVAGLEKDAADAKAEMARQQTRAANAEKSLLELQERVKPRHLTPEQHAELVRRLKLAPRGKVLLTCPIDDNEACDFLREIGTALTDAGWKAVPDMPRLFPDVIPPSLELAVRNKDANPPVEALDLALEGIGLKITNRAIFPALAEEFNVRVLVGRKTEKRN